MHVLYLQVAHALPSSPDCAREFYVLLCHSLVHWLSIFVSVGSLTLRTFGVVMAGARVDDPSYLLASMKEWGTPDDVQQALTGKGYTTVALVAHALPEPDALEPFLLAVLGRPASHIPGEALFPCSCGAATCCEGMPGYGWCVLWSCSSISSAAVVLVPATRLSAADVTQLKSTFQTKYPSELLTAELTPSLPFLMLLKEGLDAKQLPWIPWRSRTSEADAVAFTERRKPRTDNAMLLTLLQGSPDDDLQAPIPNQGPVEPIVRRFFGLMCNGLALLDAVHLLPLRKLMEKFVGLAVAQPVDKSLRCPSLPEVMEADRVVWLGVSALQQEHAWSLADSIAKMTHIRPDMHAGLAPRVKAVVPNAPASERSSRKRAASRDRSHRQPKAKAQKTKSSSSAAAKDKVTPSRWPANWARDISGKGFCIRFHTAKCKNKSCRYSHKCPILMANGAPCGADHAASAHSSAAH